MKINRNAFLSKFAIVLDNCGENEYNESPTHNHCKRVAFIAARIGELLKFDAADIYDLYSYGILHDCGIDYYNIHLDRTLTEQYHEFKKHHSERAESLIVNFPFLKKRINVLKYHHESYDGSGPFAVSGDDIPIFSQIIHMAHKIAYLYDNKFSPKDIRQKIEDERGGYFSPELCDVFKTLGEMTSFWVSIGDSFIEEKYIINLPEEEKKIDLNGVLQISEMFAHIIDYKSPFTIDYCYQIGQKAKIMGEYYAKEKGFDEIKIKKLMIAGYLLDIGKVIISSSITDKYSELTVEEFEEIKCHPFFTRKILEKIPEFSDIATWASNHHEKLDGSGYPLQLNGESIDFESQLIAVLNIYQALVQPRTYRMPLTYEAIFKIMQKYRSDKTLDGRIIDDVLSMFMK